MNTGLWLWPSNARAMRRMLRRVSASEHLVDAMQAIAKSKTGLSNAEIDDALSDNSAWMTRWVIDQLISLGFAEYKVDFFGGPGKYELTELGRNAISAISGKPAQKQPPAPTSPPAVASKPPAPAPSPTSQAKQAQASTQ